MSKYAFIISYTDHFIPGIKALENSIKRWTPEAKCLLFHGTTVEGTAIERFNIADRIAKDYAAICLMDADMFLTADCTLFFEIASHGFIVTGSNGMVVNFDKGYQDKYGVDLGSPDYIYPKVHTTAPIFISAQDTDWFRRLYDSRRVDHWDDFLYLNMLGILMGKDRRMLCLPPYAFTGIHHFDVKPVTGLIRKGSTILSGTEEIVYMIHGKFWNKEYYLALMDPMHGYFRDEQLGDRQKRQAFNSRKIIMEAFIDCLGGVESLPWLHELEGADSIL